MQGAQVSGQEAELKARSDPSFPSPPAPPSDPGSPPPPSPGGGAQGLVRNLSPTPLPVPRPTDNFPPPPLFPLWRRSLRPGPPGPTEPPFPPLPRLPPPCLPSHSFPYARAQGNESSPCFYVSRFKHCTIKIGTADPPIIADFADENAPQGPSDDQVTMTKTSRRRRTNAQIAAANEAESFAF